MEESGNCRNQIQRLTEIGIALSSELNLDLLLEKIVLYSRELTGADAGTLYLLREGKLHFKIMQNQTLGIFKGGTSHEKIELEPVPLDKSNVSAFSAIEQKTVRIDDVYESSEFDFSGPRRYDAVTGYRSRSMLVVPMKNHVGDVIGVLQLMNATDPATGEVVDFSSDSEQLTESLASQAAVAITNAQLIRETKNLFEGLIKVLAVAIDAKSRSTRNHIQRVALFNVTLAEAINEKTEGPFENVYFSEEELEEIRIAGWLHDVGKITTPIWVMEKRFKLEAPYNRIELIRTRFELIKKILENEALRKKLELVDIGEKEEKLEAIEKDLQEKLKSLDDDLQVLHECNLPREYMDDSLIKRLHDIAEKKYPEDGGKFPCITGDEEYHLSVQRGNLTESEIAVMRDHIVWTKKMLAQIPFSRHLKNVPLYAGQHHEKLNGTGYPEGLTASSIPLKSRILAVADMYEALTSKDRSYKKPMNMDQVLEIFHRAVEKGELDPDVVDLVIKDRVYERFEQRYRVFKDTAPAM